MVNIKVSLLPNGVKEGDILIEENGSYRIDKDETQKRKKDIASNMSDLF